MLKAYLHPQCVHCQQLIVAMLVRELQKCTLFPGDQATKVYPFSLTPLKSSAFSFNSLIKKYPAKAGSKAQGVYSDMYMTGGLGPGNFWDTQKNKYQEKSDPKNKFMKITDPKNKYFVHMSRGTGSILPCELLVNVWCSKICLDFSEGFCKSRSFNQTPKK